MLRKFPAFLILTAFFYTASAQGSSLDSVQQQRNDEMAAYYHGFMGENSFLYTGRSYVNYPPMVGHAYYDGPAYATGSAVYDGIEYKNIVLKYDVVKDQVVVQRPNGITQSVLQNRLLSRFTLGDKNFIRIESLDQKGDSLLSFYEVIEPGKLTILVHKQKKISEKVSGMQMALTVTEKTFYHALYNGKYYPISNLSSLLDIVPEKKTGTAAASAQAEDPVPQQSGGGTGCRCGLL